MEAGDVLAAIRAYLTDLTPSSHVGAFDRFFSLHGAGMDGIDAADRDRAFVLVPEDGPSRSGRSRCADRIGLGLGVRYVDRPESEKQMLNDVIVLREALEGLPAAVPGIKECRVDGPRYDYQVLPDSVLVLFSLAVEFQPTSS